jgi:RNA polymerase sigma-70 factor (ECF subfamily)
MTSGIDSDEELTRLLRRCGARDGVALQRLYELTAPLLFAILTRMLRRRAVAEEALQDVFVTVWQRAGQYQPERGAPKAWLVSIARYRAIDVLRRERLGPIAVAEVPELSSESAETETTAERLPGAAVLERCLELLTAEQRRCLELAFVGGNSYSDVSRLLGSPVGTVKSWIRRGLQTLKNCLGA